jgi:hypothetical protein
MGGGVVFCLLGLYYLIDNLAHFDWSAGFVIVVRTVFPGLIAIVIGLILLRGGRAIWTGRS